MDNIDKQLEDVFSNIDWKVEIDTKYGVNHYKETLMLPKYIRDHVTDIIRGYIRDKNTITETIYFGQIGNSVFTVDKLISEINKISEKAGISIDEMKIRVGDDNNEEFTIEYKIPWSIIKLDELAKLATEREIRKYVTDYETMVRVIETKESAND